jgi:hypothetical protein
MPSVIENLAKHAMSRTVVRPEVIIALTAAGYESSLAAVAPFGSWATGFHDRDQGQAGAGRRVSR